MKMLKVKLTTADPKWPLQRQTPAEAGIWGNCQFFIDSDIEECDFWVVLGDLCNTQTSHCPVQNTLLLTNEPPSIKSYPLSFIQQFGAIITCNRQIKAPNVIYSHSSLPWHVGRKTKNHANLGFSKNYDELSGLNPFDKKRLISVITSDKAFTRGHRQRIDFVKKLKQHFGSVLDVYGRGINEIEDKWDAIRDYQYHIALENCSYPDYWTEKLSDVYLAGAVPIYYGCPNLTDYFSRSSFVSIQYDFKRAVAVIEKTLNEDRYTDFVPEIIRARTLILDQYNLFPRLRDYINQAVTDRPKLPVTLKPAQQCASLPFQAKEKIQQVLSRFI
jgi:hypothetical protein